MAGGSIAPSPTFAENRAKLVNNRQISAEIWFLTPHFWALTPNFSIPSEGPEEGFKNSAWLCTVALS